MSRTPVDQLSHKPGQMSEEVEYVLGELKLAINSVSSALEKKLDKKEMIEIITDTQMDRQKAVHSELLSSVSILSEKVDALNLAMKALCAKLDAENVTDMDNDYASSISDNL